MSSPLTSAHKNGALTHAGERYSSAGWAALKVCITTIVVTSPATYAAKVE